MTEAVITLLIVLGVMCVLALAVLLLMIIIKEDEKSRKRKEFSDRLRKIQEDCNLHNIDSIDHALAELDELRKWYDEDLR